MVISVVIPPLFGVDFELTTVGIFSHLKVVPHSNFVIIFWAAAGNRTLNLLI